MPIGGLDQLFSVGASTLDFHHGDSIPFDINQAPQLSPLVQGPRALRKLRSDVENSSFLHATSFLHTGPAHIPAQRISPKTAVTHLHRAPLSFSQYPPPGYPPPGQVHGGPQLHTREQMNDAAGRKHGDTPGKGDPLEFRTRGGEVVLLCSDSKMCCEKSCLEDPTNKDELPPPESAGSDQMAKVEPENPVEVNTDECIDFCKKQFQLLCFPGDSTVAVRGRGRVPLAEVEVGDPILAIRRQAGPLGSISGDASTVVSWEMHFDTIVAWLHREPLEEAEFLCIRHELGQIHMTPNHLLFVQRMEGGGVSAAPVLACEVRVGDRVLTPWVDGSLSSPKVRAIESVTKKGVYAPLLSGGTIMVDGTAASCYAIPADISSSALYAGVCGMLDESAMQAVYHALFLPLRLACRMATHVPLNKLSGSTLRLLDCQEATGKDALARKEYDAVHPYAWALYVIFASMVR